ncbi:MFS transporter [Halococcus saccharolyticus]|uniref:Transmembrane efflux protein n=1 Tax=Halococcus saccharolyticus DSM 5350 TaxID=1227455 RepID=M0MTW8_9EURY|nr:MFS transporter [Halococcus saccharolyticus]EMA47905.1 transmembrane efflux protein [Halococcus saccharolyticus DSM 5350]
MIETGSTKSESGSGFEFWAPAVVAGTALFLGVLDMSMMNVAVPSIVQDLNTTVSAMHGAIAVYSMVMAALIIPGGALRSVVDTKRLLVITLVIYSVGTLLAGASPNMLTLFVGWSIIEGIAAALLLPITYSIIVENYAGSARTKAFGAIGGVTAVGIAIGPMIGGVLTTFATWRWGMFGEFGIVLVVLALTRYLDSQPVDRRVAIDVGGTVLSILGVVTIVGGTLLAGRYGWVRPLRPFVVSGVRIEPLGFSPAIWSIALGVALLVLFVQWETRQARAGRSLLIPTDVLRNRTFAAGIATFAAESLFLSGFMFSMPVFLQSALGYSAFQTGLALLPFSVATLLVATISTGWRAYVAPKHIVQGGLVLMAAGLLLLVALTDLDLTLLEMVLPMAVIGIGLGLFTGQLVDLTMSAVPSSEASVASGVINSLSQLGYAFGTAVAGSFLLAGFYGNVVDGVTQFVARSPISGAERRQLIVTLEDQLDTTTQAQQEAFVNQLPPATRGQLLDVVQMAMETAQQGVLLLIVVFVLLTLVTASLLPAVRPR